MSNAAVRIFVLILAGVLAAPAAETIYQTPPKAIVDALNAAPPPTLSLSPTHQAAIVEQAIAHPTIAELARPMLRLAGLRISSDTNGPHLLPLTVSFSLVRLPGGATSPVLLPAGEHRLSDPVWSPDGKRFAFTDTTAHAIELWTGDTATGRVHRVPGVRINAVIGNSNGPFGRRRPPIEWMPDGRTLLVRLVPQGRGAPPPEPKVPTGPDVQESDGHSGPVRTYEDMLQNAHDEDLFTYYATSQLALVDPVSGKITPVGKPAIFTTAEPSPDGRYFLIEKIHRPFSYLHPFLEFPTDIEIWDRAGRNTHTIANLPLADRIPIEGVRTGPRDAAWLPVSGATLVWVEALDGGDPRAKAAHRDRILTLAAPFTAAPTPIFETEQRFRGLEAFDDGHGALVSDYDRDRRWLRTQLIDLTNPATPAKVVFSRNIQDRYRDPGAPLEHTLPNGHRAIWLDNGAMYLIGAGASPTGDHPFLARYTLSTANTERLFTSGDNVYETPEAVLDSGATRILTRRESPTEAPNYFVRTASGETAVTHYRNPNPELLAVRKELVKYQREDGVLLSFTLYLPPGYKPGTRLPALVWAYPYEYNDASTAGQVSGSPLRFPRLTGHQLLVLAGYALLDNAAMPVIGKPATVNDTYLQQIVMDARAAIGKAASMGVVDPARVAAGGHSYGAFMTANLLAHSDLFRAGLAESGAYNRTLTPFGFQTERRTIWQDPDLYLKMSPFMSADHIKAPILLIHGEADDNPGTFPINSERLYQAVRGNGGTVRLVMLPLEAHAYAARETLEEVLAEELNWMNKYLKTTATGEASR